MGAPRLCVKIETSNLLASETGTTYRLGCWVKRCRGLAAPWRSPRQFRCHGGYRIKHTPFSVIELLNLYVVPTVGWRLIMHESCTHSYLFYTRDDNLWWCNLVGSVQDSYVGYHTIPEKVIRIRWMNRQTVRLGPTWQYSTSDGWRLQAFCSSNRCCWIVSFQFPSCDFFIFIAWWSNQWYFGRSG